MAEHGDKRFTFQNERAMKMDKKQNQCHVTMLK